MLNKLLDLNDKSGTLTEAMFFLLLVDSLFLFTYFQNAIIKVVVPI